MQIHSWGRYFRVEQKLHHADWSTEVARAFDEPGLILAHGLGRSYGDSCLNEGANLLITTGFDRFLGANWDLGLVRCAAGMSLDTLLKEAVPRGFFVPVTPGTKYVTVGGAVANDVHGKNHHSMGTFGRHVVSFELIRSTGERLVCSPTQNSELFAATIGGLGLTGIMTWIDIQLLKIPSSDIDAEVVKFKSFEEFLELSEASDKDFVYTVAWFDCMQTQDRGHFIRGNHSKESRELKPHRDPKLLVPIEFPGWALNPLTMKAFNKLYYNRIVGQIKTMRQHYEPFFYPLDAIHHWNRIYGKRGFFQYQIVLPPGEEAAFQKILARIRSSQQGSFLAVLKTFGSLPSPGILSFPMAGTTLTLDFPNRGAKTGKLFAELEDEVLEHGGRFYPAKDSVMSPRAFRASYPRLGEFLSWLDPRCSSSFWRRVNREAG